MSMRGMTKYHFTKYIIATREGHSLAYGGVGTNKDFERRIEKTLISGLDDELLKCIINGDCIVKPQYLKILNKVIENRETKVTTAILIREILEKGEQLK